MKMMLHSNKCSFICLGVILMGIAGWKHFFESVKWSQISFSYFVRSRQRYNEDVQIWETEPNCGVHHACPQDSFPIFLSTAASPDNQPRLCVAGNYVIKPTQKEEGRGLNAAVVESNNFRVISVRNFDTYLYNKSVEISEWIDGILDNDILIIFTSDEASAKLSGETKTLLNELGSGKIQNLQYRSQWFMITQKGTSGFTTYEKITYSKKKSWGDTIEFRGCVPSKIPKKVTTADEPLKQNRKKAQFCEGKRDERYKAFCNEPRFEIIMPALVTNKSLLENLAYSVPIYIYASEDLEVVISCMDNMIHQPGVVASLITVLFDSNSADIPGLVKIYGMHSNRTKIAGSFTRRLKQARDISRNLHPNKKYLIVLDSGVLPSPDFLYFMAQTLPVLEKDSTLTAISGWSSNCYQHNGSLHLAYRINGAPKHAALISATSDKKDFYGEIITPDVARVQGVEACHLPSLEPNNWIDRPQDLLKDRYYHKLVILQQLGQVIEEEDILNSCSNSVVKNETNVVYVQSKEKSLSSILLCLGVLKNQYGEYNGIIRLSIVDKLELSKNNEKTSSQIGLKYSPARTIMFDKHTSGVVPKVRVNADYKVGSVYTPIDGLKSTYNESYKVPTESGGYNVSKSRVINPPRPYSKFGKQAKPLAFGTTEYAEEYPIKPLPPNTKGVSVVELTTCPMELTGRDERDPLPLTSNYSKYLDIYLSTARLAHRPFTLHEQRTIAAKNIVTSQETMEIPKGRGFGCRFREFPGQDLDNRDKKMFDKAKFKSEHKLRYVPKGMPRVPNFGSESETQAAYTKPDGVALAHLFDKFIDYPQTIGSPSAKQTLCAPGMYTTESYAINKHTSPQAVL